MPQWAKNDFSNLAMCTKTLCLILIMLLQSFSLKKTKASAAGIKTDCLTKYVGYNDSV